VLLALHQELVKEVRWAPEEDRVKQSGEFHFFQPLSTT
jgi:hypothetical protein